MEDLDIKDILDCECSCEKPRLSYGKGREGEQVIVCSKCFTDRCPECHVLCTVIYYGIEKDECYDCEEYCDRDNCLYRREVKVKAVCPKFNFEYEFETEVHDEIYDPADEFENEIDEAFKKERKDLTDEEWEEFYENLDVTFSYN
jgi:hypothetical protein